MEGLIKIFSGFVNLIKPMKRDEPHPTLRFHTMHGENIFLDDDRSTVSRVISYDDGIAFSDRPIELNEVVPIKILEIRKYRGPLFFGLTTINPITLRNNQLSLIRRNLDHRYNGIWLKGLHSHTMQPNMLICFKVLPNGVVKYSIDRVAYETRLRDVDIHAPMWAVFDVYGSVGGIKLVQPPAEGMESLRESSFRDSPVSTSEAPSIFVFPPTDSPMIDTSSSGSSSPSDSNVSLHSFMSPRTPSSTPAPNDSFRTPTSPTANYENKECIICIDNAATTAFVKCGHMCLCYDCASRFLDCNEIGLRRKIHKCPVCRKPILDILRVYIA